MANIIALKRRINAARNVSKTTKAMQMIAASKLKRAQNAVMASKPYVSKISSIMDSLMTGSQKNYNHPYLNPTSNTGKTLLLLMSPDKGLCGSLITNLLKEFIKYQENSPETSYVVLGKKLEGQVVHFNNEIIAAFPFGTSLPTFDKVYPLTQIIEKFYLGGLVDSVKILSPEYVNLFTQKPKITTLLPITLSEEILDEKGEQDEFYLFEPNRKALLESLLKHYLEMTLYHQLIESFVSEQAARMISMQNATTNANDIIEDLQLEYNKTRQAKITSELLDITGSSEVANNG
jgi:F-type H+-transporting ATPase subunit gamma